MTRPESPYPGLNYTPTVRAAAALPAAGAWDTDPLVEIITAGLEQLTLYITYDEDAQATDGAVNFRIEYSPYYADAAGVEDWFPMPLYDAGALVPGADVTSQIQRENITYDPTVATAETFIYAVTIAGTVERLRVPCREIGDTDNPGECHIRGVLW